MTSIGASAERLHVAQCGDPSEVVSERQQKIDGLWARLTDDVPPDILQRSEEEQAKWVLANILDWHRREDKATWWEYFRLWALSPEELLDEPSAISGLEFLGPVGGTEKAPVHRYRFPAQETDLRGGEKLRSCGGARFGTLEVISFENRTVDVKKRGDTASQNPVAIFAHDVIDAGVLADALLRIGESISIR